MHVYVFHTYISIHVYWNLLNILNRENSSLMGFFGDVAMFVNMYEKNSAQSMISIKYSLVIV